MLTMRIYKCRFTGDELFSDSFPFKLVDGVLFEITLSLMDKRDPLDPSITEQVLDVIDSYGLWEISMKKSEFVAYFKKYVKRIKTRLTKEEPDRVPEFTANVTKQFQRILGMWKDVQLYMGSSNDSENGALGILYWDDQTPRLCFFKDGLIAQKV